VRVVNGTFAHSFLRSINAVPLPHHIFASYAHARQVLRAQDINFGLFANFLILRVLSAPPHPHP
jgi:hypothetical protein